MTDPLTRMAAREIEERYHEYPKAARAMLAALEAIKQFGELNCEPVSGYWGNSGKKPPTKDVWQFPRFMLTELDEAIAAAKAAGIKP